MCTLMAPTLARIVRLTAKGRKGLANKNAKGKVLRSKTTCFH